MASFAMSTLFPPFPAEEGAVTHFAPSMVACILKGVSMRNGHMGSNKYLCGGLPHPSGLSSAEGIDILFRDAF